MQIFEITAWSKREYNPTWVCKVEAATIGDAWTEGNKQFSIQCPELDHSKYTVNAGTYRYC